MMIIKCAMCESEATNFYTYELWARAWRNNPKNYVAHRCDRCLRHLTSTPGVEQIINITKEDYLAALAMAEL